MHRQIYGTLAGEIRRGVYGPGEKLPSEADLVRRFAASRITIGRAVRDLQHQGLVDRRAGSGTYVRPQEAVPTSNGRLFGLLIPDLGATEIFEPICRGMASAINEAGGALVWGREEAPWQLCQDLIARKVAGVFFAPLELDSGKDALNARITAALRKACIPVVLLDRDIVPYPGRSTFDLVGIDNRRAGYRITEHMLRHGARRVVFAAYPDSAPTVDARIAGYREAMFRYGARHGRIWTVEPGSAPARMRSLRPDAIVCANDRTAGELMRELLEAGYRLPDDVRIAGIDDVRYAQLLPVPLTTIRQPCAEVGAAAMAAMRQRLARPEAAPCEILLDCELIVRRSCGARPS